MVVDDRRALRWPYRRRRNAWRVVWNNQEGFGRVRKRGFPLLRRLNESSAGVGKGKGVWWYVEREKEGGVFFFGFGMVRSWRWAGKCVINQIRPLEGDKSRLRLQYSLKH